MTATVTAPSGNPYAPQMAAFREAVYRVLTPQALEGLVLDLIALAKEGSISAYRLLLSYALGRPGKFTDPIEPAAVEETPMPAPVSMPVEARRAVFTAPITNGVHKNRKQRRQEAKQQARLAAQRAKQTFLTPEAVSVGGDSSR